MIIRLFNSLTRYGSYTIGKEKSLVVETPTLERMKDQHRRDLGLCFIFRILIRHHDSDIPLPVAATLVVEIESKDVTLNMISGGDIRSVPVPPEQVNSTDELMDFVAVTLRLNGII